MLNEHGRTLGDGLNPRHSSLASDAGAKRRLEQMIADAKQRQRPQNQSAGESSPGPWIEWPA